MNNKSLMVLSGLLLLVLLAFSSMFIVTEYQRAVMLEFGRLVNADIEPGFHLKKPWANVRKFDGRLMTADVRPENFYTSEKKRLVVSYYIKWRVKDVETYYKVTGGDEVRAADLLAKPVADGLRNQFGRRTLHDVVSGKRDELMAEITASTNEQAIEDLGVEVKDIRIKRIDFPDEVSRSVFDRMAADREKEAREYRSSGTAQGETIRADADRQKAVIEAEAYSQAEKIRGEGDAKAAAIFAAAYSKDPEFYNFVRSLNAYRSSFQNKGDLMVVDPGSDFFRYLKDPKGQK